MHRVRWPSLFLIAAVMAAACTAGKSSPTSPSGSSVTVTAISVTGSNTLTVGATVTMTATATESDGSTQNVTTGATWQSSNPPVATVSSSGEVKGVAPGTSTISASYQGTTGQLKVQVNAPAAAAPSSTSPPVITGGPVQGQTLTAGPGSWSGTQPISLGYQWLRCDASGSSCATVSGASSLTYVLGATDVGHTIRVKVTAINSVGSASATSAATAAVGGSTGPPAVVSGPTISGTPAVGQTLTATSGVWGGSMPMSFSYQWDRCDTAGNSCTNVPGATASTFTPGAADAGHTMRVVVSASNSLGTSSATSAPTSPVQ